MAGFINTVDVIGDEALTDQIIDRSITEYKDNSIVMIGVYAFYSCTNLASVDIPNVTHIESRALSNCSKLKSLILRNTASVCTIADTNTLTNTLIASGKGYIYVPAALVDSYKSATNWSVYAAQFRALEDYTVDGTTTGELDPTKI